jgi:hypothetical protein
VYSDVRPCRFMSEYQAAILQWKINQGNIMYFFSVSDPDPGFGAFPDPWIRDLGWLQNQDPE